MHKRESPVLEVDLLALPQRVVDAFPESLIIAGSKRRFQEMNAQATHLECRLWVEGIQLETAADDPDAVGSVLRRGGPGGGEPGGRVHDREEYRRKELVEGDHFLPTDGWVLFLRKISGFYV